jgi:hypothetical protein
MGAGRTPLRRGAWYPVLSAAADEAVLEVRKRAVIVARDQLEIVDVRPSRWSVVPRQWMLGGPYAVCPKCAERVALTRSREPARCGRCNGMFAIE